MNTKSKNIITWVAVVTAVLMLCVTVASVLTQGFTKSNLRPEPTVEAGLDHNDNILVEPQENNAMQMSVLRAGPPTTSDEGVALTATLSPVTVENKTVCWSLKWKDGESVWGQEKTAADYVSLSSETSVSGESVTLSCQKDFGEQIIVTAAAESNTEVFASCTVDYCQKIKSVSYQFKYGDKSILAPVEDANGVYKVDYTGEDNSYRVRCVPEYTDFTVADNFTESVNGAFTDAFGYTISAPFTELTVQAGLSGGSSEPALSDKATEFISRTDGACAPGNWQAGVAMINNANTLYEALTPADKLHSKVINRYEAMQRFSGKCNSAATFYEAQTEANKVLGGYIAPTGGNFHGSHVASEDALLTAAKACNDAGSGILQFAISFAGEHSTANFIFKLGYTESSVQAARSLSMSLPSVLF